jgi:hypothetical protein
MYHMVPVVYTGPVQGQVELHDAIWAESLAGGPGELLIFMHCCKISWLSSLLFAAFLILVMVFQVVTTFYAYPHLQVATLIHTSPLMTSLWMLSCWQSLGWLRTGQGRP